MIRVNVTIEGTTPLLLHRFTDESAMNATEGNRTSVATGERGSAYEQAEQFLYLNDVGEPVIPGPNLLRCFIDAGKFFKAGRTKVTTQKTSLVPACVAIDELVIPIEHTAPWEVDTRPIRIPATGGRILRHRPMFRDWKLSITMSVDTSLMTAKMVREIVDTAGKQIGLGDFRPDTKGPFGRFVVTRWEEASE